MYLYIIISILTGKFIDFLIVFSLIITHECGHFYCAKILGIKTKEIIIYPLGGISIMDMDISLNPFKEALILLMGPIIQTVFYMILLKIGIHINLIRYYHYGILLFNLLPIIPLDGGRLLNIFINSIFPYKKTLYISVVISYLVTIILLFMNKSTSLSMIVTYVVLILLIHKEELKISIHFNKFLLERILKEYHYKRISHILKEQNMYRYRYNMFNYNNKWVGEKDYLSRKYLT